MKKTLIIVFLVLLTSCSVHLERNNKTISDYFEQINMEYNTKKVIVTFVTNETEEGIFIHLDKKTLAIQKESGIIEFSTKSILNIKYDRGFSFSGMGIGAVTGFGLGMLASLVGERASGAKLNFVQGDGGGNGAVMILAIIPVFTIIGAVWGGLEIDKYNTVNLNNRGIK